MTIGDMTFEQADSATAKVAEAARALIKSAKPHDAIKLRTLCDYFRPNMYVSFETVADLLDKIGKAARQIEKESPSRVLEAKADLEAALKELEAAMDAHRMSLGLSSDGE